MTLRGIHIDLSGGQLSDLFFNFDHPKRDALYNSADTKTVIDAKELHDAITSDATDFVATLGVDPFERDELVAELVADFEKRV